MRISGRFFYALGDPIIGLKTSPQHAFISIHLEASSEPTNIKPTATHVTVVEKNQKAILDRNIGIVKYSPFSGNVQQVIIFDCGAGLGLEKIESA